MPPRRGDNRRTSKARGSVAGDSWRSEIEDLSLNDDLWTCAIAMIVETRPEHAAYLELFDEAAEDGAREAILSLSYRGLIRGTKSLARSEPRQGICQFAVKIIEAEGEAALGPWLVSRLIKFFVNRAKARNLEALRSRKGIAAEIEALGARGRPNAVAGSKDTGLRKRGRELNRVDDAPVGGPDLYIVLTGFRDANLPAELLDAGLPLTGIFKVLRPGEEPDLDHPELRGFWSNFEATLEDPKAAARYSQVVVQTFCPPDMEGTGSEALGADAYRRISSLAYDLWDLKRRHADYIGGMRLQTGLKGSGERVRASGRYDTIMSSFPEECVTVSVVLDALLSEIAGSDETGEIFNGEKKYPETFEERLKSKIDGLNKEFDVFDVGRAEIHTGNLDTRFIFQRDYPTIAADFGIRVSRGFAESLIWRNLPALTSEKLKTHGRHIREISACFDGDLDSSTTGHYLHLLLFDKLINGKNPRRNLPGRVVDLGRKISSPGREELREKSNVRRAKSQIDIASGKSPSKILPASLSDGAIDYGKEISDSFECPELFGLVDTREILRPGNADAPEPEAFSGLLDLEEFDTVQFLSAELFPEIFIACQRDFDALEARYFPPTDSVLLCFHNYERTAGQIFEHEYAASIPTPVCLRDFVRFVIDEEREEPTEKEDPEPESRTPKADTPPTVSYTDSDFVLEDSIKGAEKREEKSRRERIDATKTGEELSAGSKGRPKDEAIFPGRERESLTREKNAAVPSILGYDVSDRRVEVSGLSSEFASAEGSLVKVNREEWSCGRPRLEIMIELLGSELTAHSVAGEGYVAFHFAAGNGILMGFSVPLKGRGSGRSITKRNYQGGKTGRESEAAATAGGVAAWPAEMAVDPGLRASWPSGLVLETLPGDGPSEPFYIKQSYRSRGPGCTGIAGETGRAFLRDGSVIVFLEDRGVRVISSNGRIVERKSMDSPFTGDGDNERTKARGIHRSVVLEPDGSLYEILDDERTRDLGQELVRTTSDYEVGEKFTRRGDGTDMLIGPDGSLAVSFPDGSRITTGYVIAEEPVFCEWTEEEIRRFHPSDINTGSKSWDKILDEDGFVSIFLTSFMEHKNYATVAYDQSKISCTLSMPGDVSVRITSENLFSVRVGGGASLKVTRSGIEFAGRTGRSVFNLGDSSGPYFESKDSSGNIFRVNIDGETSCEKFGECPRPAETGANQSRPDSRSYRLFAAKRDLSAYEHLRNSERQTREDEPIPGTLFPMVHQQSGHSLGAALTALNPITASHGWLQPYRTARGVRPTNEDRRDLLRSTYSVPWNYLIPYGKNGRGIRDRTWNLPLKDRGDFTRPESPLLDGTTRTIKGRGVRMLKKLRAAVGRHLFKIDNFGERRGSVSPKCPWPKECETEDPANDFATGRGRTLDEPSHFEGPYDSRCRQMPESRMCVGRNSRSKDKSKEEEEEEEIEWYKTCLRDQTVPSYFDDVTGACFTWVLECVNKIGAAGDEGRE